jgi:hypothetical protein
MESVYQLPGGEGRVDKTGLPGAVSVKNYNYLSYLNEHFMRKAALTVLIALFLQPALHSLNAQQDDYPFRDEIRAFMKEDSLQFPPAHAILFVGSSSFQIRKEYKKIPIVFVSIKPSPSRERLMPEMLAANLMIKNFLAKKRKSYFVDIYHKMLTPGGKPMPDIFVSDNLHMNRKGYAIWQQAIQPFLVKK